MIFIHQLCTEGSQTQGMLLFEFSNHILDTRYGLDLPRMLRLEILHKRALAQPSENGEVIHFIAGRYNTGMIAGLNGESRSINNIKCLTPITIWWLKELHPKSMVWLETEVIDLVMACFIR